MIVVATWVAVTAVAAIAAIAATITSEYNKWKAREKYINGVIDAATEYNPEECDRNLIEACKELVKQEFPNGIPETLKPLSLEDRTKLISNFTEKVCATMDINIDSLNFLEPEACCGCMGYYNHNDNSISINSAYLNVEEPDLLKEAVKTIFHECKHARQHAAVFQTKDYGYSSRLIAQWLNNIRPNENYIRTDESDEGYRKQPLEADAFGFENSIIEIV